MRVISWNVNGVRAVAEKGFLKWLQAQKADIVCLQETKASEDQLDLFLRNPQGYQSYWHSAEKAGYSGTAIYTRAEPHDVIEGLGLAEFDKEGRVLQMDFGDFRLINAYFPNSQRDHARLEYKLDFCKAMLKHTESLRKKGKQVILCGDFNIAHHEIDLRNPKENQNNAGFLPKERAWLDKFESAGYVDTFRRFTKDPGHYTWWSYRPGVRARNIGWRLDYFWVCEEFSARLTSAYHQPEVLGSDHCPVVLEFS
ncbi:MAG: exodeoxyribonuclease III [Bdellovibrionales bacterium]|nr:exodeoxyribonuclease III [Bdellovibrionales bacterium]